MAGRINNEHENIQPEQKDTNENSPVEELKKLKLKYWDRVVIGCLNINSIRNKFDMLTEIVRNSLDVLILQETKLDDSFPDSQFRIEGFTAPYRCDRNKNGGGVMIFVKDNISSRMLRKFKNGNNFEGIFVELNLRKQKILLFGGYRSDHETYGLDKGEFLHQLGLGLDAYSGYDKILAAGDFNMSESDPELQDFLAHLDGKCLVKEPTCFKNVNSPSTVDHFITNAPRLFQKTMALNIGLSDFHKLIVTVLKTGIPKQQPKTVIYRNYRNFDENRFRYDLRRELNKNRAISYENFEKIFLEVLEKHAPSRTKKVRANDKPFITKPLHKAMMATSQMEKKFHRNPSQENKAKYKKKTEKLHKRLCIREKKKFIQSLDFAKLEENKKFWKTLKPFFSDKGNGQENITLLEGDEI